jgi:hypothetical protein
VVAEKDDEIKTYKKIIEEMKNENIIEKLFKQGVVELNNIET